MKTTLRAALMAVAFSAPLAAQFEAPIVDTTLESLRRDPTNFKNVRVRFQIQFCSVGKIYNPFFTGFVPSDYANFIGWSVEQPIWRKDDYNDMFGLMFVSKRNNRGLQKLYGLELYDRVELVGSVRNVFQNEPWIEIESFRNLKDRVNTVSLSHLYRGEALMERREWRRAITELSMAPANDVPNEVLGAVARNLGTCYLRLGEVRPAIANLERAADLLPRDRSTRNLLSQVRQSPDVGLDRSVDASRVLDHERPMWEAFEDETFETASPGR